MDEQTTTEPVLPPTGAEEPAQPVEQTEAAATPPEEPKQPNDAPSDEPSVTDENLAWLKSKGVDPNDPEAVRKIAEMYRNAEKTMHQSTARASELEKTLLTETPAAPADGTEPEVIGQLVTEVQQLKQAQAINGFFNDPEQGPDRKAYEPKMAELITNDPQLKQLVNSGYVSVEQLYYMAKGSDAGREDQLKQDGGRQALQTVADKQNARAVTGVATSSDLAPTTDDPLLQGFNKVK